MRRTIAMLLFALPLLAQSNSEHDAYGLRQNLLDRQGRLSVTGWSWNSGYVVGVAEAQNNEAFCIPGLIRSAELNEVVIKYINEHPTVLHKDRVLAVALALADAYPCKK
jgi:Rap1a immunity proteins